MATLLFIIPSGDAKKRGPLMNWATALRVLWGILLLFGGGFAVAGAFSQTGLDRSMGETLRPIVGQLGPWAMILIVCLFVTFLTELTSNTATAAALIPIMAATAMALGINPLLLMIPTTISASCAFMLPVATPPNAIIFGSGKVKMGEMVRTGLILNALVALIVATFLYFVLLPAWEMAPSMPGWAH
jgi:sodium-dependent dicarboxylate transporter 2/3/5